MSERIFHWGHLQNLQFLYMVLHMLWDIVISCFLIKKNIMKVSGIMNDISFESKNIWVSRFNIELWAKLLVLKHMVHSAKTSITFKLRCELKKKGYWIYVRKNISLRPPSKFAFLYMVLHMLWDILISCFLN